MPTHPKLGEYEIEEDGTVAFQPLMLGDVEIDPVIFGGEPDTSEADFAAICALFEQLVPLAAKAHAHVIEDWQEHVVEMAEDLSEANPDMDILGMMFPGSGITSASEITKEMAAKAIHVENAFGSYDSEFGPSITMDLRFKDSEINYIIAVLIDASGEVKHISMES